MINKELNNKLWKMANDLRGNTSMDLAELKNYVLGIMFYKFISDKNESWYKDELEKDADNIKDIFNSEAKQDLMFESKKNLGFAIELDDLFSTFIKQIKEDKYSNENFQKALMNFNSSIESDEDFANLFDDLRLSDTRLGSTTKEQSAVIAKIMLNIEEIEHETEAFSSDILGNAYEYLISKFASNAGKKAGEFYTPQYIADLLAGVVTNGKKEIEDIYDPTAGSGSLLIRIASKLKRFKSINGQELINTTYNLARMNMIIHDIKFDKFSIRQGDTIADDKFKEDKFDAIVSNPPYGTKWDSPESLKGDNRFYNYGAIAPKGAMEMSFVQHIEYHLKPNGVAAILLPVGVLFRTGAENIILKKLIDDNILDSVVLLPSNMFFSTSIPVIMMVLKKNKTKEDYFMIDASDLCIKEGKKNVLKKEHIDNILNLLNERKNTQISKSLSIKEIEENNYNLNITRYIQRVKEEVIDIDKLGKDIKQNLKKLRTLEEKIEDDILEIKNLL